MENLGTFKDNTKIYLRKIFLWGCVNWIYLAQDSSLWQDLVNMLMNRHML